MSAERQDASVAYNLLSKSKSTGLPAVTSASGSEPTAAKPVDDLQKAELKSEVRDRTVGPVCSVFKVISAVENKRSVWI